MISNWPTVRVLLPRTKGHPVQQHRVGYTEITHRVVAHRMLTVIFSKGKTPFKTGASIVPEDVLFLGGQDAGDVECRHIPGRRASRSTSHLRLSDNHVLNSRYPFFTPYVRDMSGMSKGKLCFCPCLGGVASLDSITGVGRNSQKT